MAGSFFNKLRECQLWIRALRFGILPPFLHRAFVASVKKRYDGRFSIIGLCTFIGPQSFLDDAAEFESDLRRLDTELHARIFHTREQIFFTWTSGSYADYGNRMYSIPKAYCAWGKHGIGAIVLRDTFISEKAGLDLPSTMTYFKTRSKKERSREADRQTYETLRRLNYPEALIECFQEDAPKP